MAKLGDKILSQQRQASDRIKGAFKQADEALKAAEAAFLAGVDIDRVLDQVADLDSAILEIKDQGARLDELERVLS